MTIPCETVSNKEIDLAVYGRDASCIEGKVREVCWPKDKEELRAVVHYCKRNKIPIALRGGGTSMSGGAVPNNSIIIDLSKMNHIYEIKDDYVMVECGVSCFALNKEISGNTGRQFPIEPVNCASTIGGMLATNASSLNGRRIRDYVIGVWGVNGEGKFLKLPLDIIGTEGTLAVITHAKIELVEPGQTTMNIFSYNTYTALGEAVKEFQAKAEEEGIISMEYFDSYCSKLLGWNEKLHLAVEYNSSKGSISELETKAFWLHRKELFYALQARQYQFEKFRVPVQNLDKLLYWLGENKIAALGHLRLDIVHPVYNPKIQSWNEIIETAGRLGAVPIGPFGLVRKAINPNIENIRILKREYDPSNVLNANIS